MFEMIRRVDKVLGSEEWIVKNDQYCGKILNLDKGYKCSMHYHKDKHETFYLLEGRVLMELDGECSFMDPGDIREIKPNQKHRFTGMEDSRIIEFSTHHEDSDSYRDEDKLSGMADLERGLS
jgi:mannose-6-phosphate isomerase-like protein (cupin superfamily)